MAQNQYMYFPVHVLGERNREAFFPPLGIQGDGGSKMMETFQHIPLRVSLGVKSMKSSRKKQQQQWQTHGGFYGSDVEVELIIFTHMESESIPIKKRKLISVISQQSFLRHLPLRPSRYEGLMLQTHSVGIVSSTGLITLNTLKASRKIA